MKKEAEVESDSMIEFEGKMTPKVMEKKMAVLRKRREIIDEKLGVLEERLAVEKYKNTTLDEMEGLWNSSDSYGRMELAKSVPFFKTHIEGLGFSEEHNILLKDEVFCYEFREENENGDSAVEFFEEYCKK